MSALVLLNLLNKLGKSDKMRGLPRILSLFRNKFTFFKNTGAQLLNLFYHMTLKLLKNYIFGCENVKILSSLMQCFNGQLNINP